MNTRQKINLAFTILLILGLLTSCHFNNQYIDRVEDKIEAEKVSNIFYEDLKNDTISELTLKLFSDKFWQTGDKQSFIDMMKKTQEKIGKLKVVKLDHWKTRVVVGSNPSSEYILYYFNEYENFTAKETVSLMKENDTIKIVGYNINSEGFLK